MEYFSTFFWGLVSFLSPCMLPMLPIYLSYFSNEQSGKTFWMSLGFVSGFSVVFCTLGLFIGGLGALLSGFHETVEKIGGVIIVLLGLNTLGVFHFPHGKGGHKSPNVTGFVSAFLFGVVFSVGHIPCVAAFLGTALATAGVVGSVWKSVLMLLSYSVGMGLPFLACAFIVKQIGPFIQKVKQNYGSIRLVCGILLILLGVFMTIGWLHKLLHI